MAINCGYCGKEIEDKVIETNCSDLMDKTCYEKHKKECDKCGDRIFFSFEEPTFTQILRICEELNKTENWHSRNPHVFIRANPNGFEAEVYLDNN